MSYYRKKMIGLTSILFHFINFSWKYIYSHDFSWRLIYTSLSKPHRSRLPPVWLTSHSHSSLPDRSHAPHPKQQRSANTPKGLKNSSLKKSLPRPGLYRETYVNEAFNTTVILKERPIRRIKFITIITINDYLDWPVIVLIAGIISVI